MSARYSGMSGPAMPANQGGVVLIVALIILLVLTLVAVTGIGNSTLEERMSANARDREVAFQAAEAALRHGENDVATGLDLSKFTTNCDNGLCDCRDANIGCVEYWTDPTLDVWNVSNRHRSYSVPFAQVASPAEYIIEYMGQYHIDPLNPAPTDPDMFRITAVGIGQTPGSKVMLQSTYLR
ncbi:MAG TPA: PilX N-terminal domain-containing pilus assembly protein [Gammaproteobacteria bacterium]|nr:PilX N-terminal domain-containing pilus assembly protein [Gammaproteobacteria bacterium]